MIAHEVGHHVQDLQGMLTQANKLQARASETEGNAIQVKIELQADCYAGVWAANARDAKGVDARGRRREEGMRAAEAIGDDTLQKQSQGYGRAGQLHPWQLGAADRGVPERIAERRSQGLRFLEGNERPGREGEARPGLRCGRPGQGGRSASASRRLDQLSRGQR